MTKYGEDRAPRRMWSYQVLATPAELQATITALIGQIPHGHVSSRALSIVESLASTASLMIQGADEQELILSWETLATASMHDNAPRAYDLLLVTVNGANAAIPTPPYTTSEYKSLSAQMPITSGLVSSYPGRPLSGAAAIFTIHHMTDFLVMLQTAVALGLRPNDVLVVDKEYAYKYSARVDAYLKQVIRVPVATFSTLRGALRDHYNTARDRGLRTIIFDDGGYVLPSLLADDAIAGDFESQTVGVVEQTTSGIWKLEAHEANGGELSLPVFTVAESRLKGAVESYGVAEACVRNFLSLVPNEKIEGRPAAVFGFGRIGSQVAEVLRGRRMIVSVHDADILALITARERGFRVYESQRELIAGERPLVVFGCAGVKSMPAGSLASIRRSCYLVSCTSRDYEFDVAALASASRRSRYLPELGTVFSLGDGVDVTLVADGYPVNFYRSESMPNRYSDIVLAAMLVGGCYLRQNSGQAATQHWNRDRINRTDAVLAQASIVRDYLRLYQPSSGDLTIQ